MSDFQTRLQQALDHTFQIERELGGAGMSRVFVATERSLDRRVVVKVLPPELAAGVNVERFRREIQLAAQLQHPHIVPLLAAGDDHGLLWFSMPYIEGESLRGTLTRQERLSPRDVVRILHDVVDALSYAHARGIVHRDIKPDNILTSGMHALVTDFGVAKALSAAIPVHGGTTTGMAIGTPAYMAPEQLAADPAADHRVDLYAVGLLAYELLTGRSPFSGSSPQATLAAQLTMMPEPPHRTLGDIPEALSLLIMHCLQKDAAKRPASAQALLAELEALPPMSGTVRARGAPRQRTALLVGGALAVGALAWAAVSDGPSSTRADSALAVLDARDASPAGGARRMEVAGGPGDPGGRADSVATAADTRPAFRAFADGQPTTTVPLVITRAESLAIAEAIRKRSEPKAPGPAASPAPTTASSGPATASNPLGGTGAAVGGPRVIVRLGEGNVAEIEREALMAEVGKIFADSMARALRQVELAFARVPRMSQAPELPARPDPRRPQLVTPLLAPPSDGRLRVVVTGFRNSTSDRAYGALARDLGRALRSTLGTDRVEVVSEEITERAMRTMPDQMAVGWGLRADYAVSGFLIAREPDSLVVVTVLTDVRTGRNSKAAETVVGAGDVAGAKDAAGRRVTAWLDTAAAIAAKRRTDVRGPQW